jgi:hypothetical protein
LSNLRRKCLIAALTSGIGGPVALDAGFVAAENLRKLSGAQIRAKFAGMQLTDEVHYRLVYERNGTLRSVALGVRSAASGSSIRTNFVSISRSRTTAAMT